MGYYTDYKLDFESECNEELDAVEKGMDEFCGEYGKGFLRNFYSGGSDECKWYNHDKDMKEFSKLFPEVVFVLEGNGEDVNDMWKKYYKNGKVQVEKARLVFGNYNESKLK